MKIIEVRLVTVVLLGSLIGVGHALGQSAGDIEKNAGSQVHAYLGCVQNHISDFAKADPKATEAQVVARANLACQSERKAALHQLQKTPLNMPPAEATRQLNEALDNIKSNTRKSNAKADPYGTFAQSGRMNYENRSGYYEWNDTLTINADGTAEMTIRYKVTLNPGWWLTGCSHDAKQGVEVLLRKFTASVSASTVTLQPQGSRDRLRFKPACWTAEKEEKVPNDPWILDWIDGHLMSSDGEYFRQ